MAAATGARPHEVLAFRWEDISGLVDEDGSTVVRLLICGTIVQLKGVGVIRQAWGKTEGATGSVVLLAWAVTVLRERWAREVTVLGVGLSVAAWYLEVSEQLQSDVAFGAREDVRMG